MQEALKNTNSANMAGELAYVVRTLQACSLTPGKKNLLAEWMIGFCGRLEESVFILIKSYDSMYNGQLMDLRSLIKVSPIQKICINGFILIHFRIY